MGRVPLPQASSLPSDLFLAMSSFGPHLILPTQPTLPGMGKKLQLLVTLPLPYLHRYPFSWGRGKGKQQTFLQDGASLGTLI